MFPKSLSPQAPLHSWAALKTELFWIYDGPVASPRMTSDHTTGYWVWLIRNGSVRINCGKYSMEAQRGQWIIPPQDILEQHFSSNSEILSIHFSCLWPTGENLFQEKKGLRFESKKYPLLEKSALSLYRLSKRLFSTTPSHLFTSQNTDYKTYWKFQQQFHQWLIDFTAVMLDHGRSFAQMGELDPRVVEAVRFLNTSPLNLPFPTKPLESKTRLGRARLDQLFWSQFGFTTRIYWDRIRLQSAFQSLKETSLSIKEILT